MKQNTFTKYFALIIVFLFTVGAKAYGQSVNPTSVSFDPSGGTQTITVAVPSSTFWNIYGCPDWTRISPPGFGFNSGSFTITCSANTSTNSRSGRVGVTTFRGILTITVTQAAAPPPPPPPPTVTITDVSPASGTQTATTNVIVSYTVDQSVTVNFYVDGTQVGSTGDNAGSYTYTISSLSSGAHLISTTVSNSNGSNTSSTIYVVLSTYTLTVNSNGGGSVTGSGTVTQGVAQAISASASSGYQFVNWSVTYGTASIANSSSASTTVTLTSGDATVTANFIPIPPPPILATPTNGDTIISTSPTFSWYASTGAASYTLQVSINSSFSSFIVNEPTITGLSYNYNANSLSNNTTYYWRVNAANAGGTSAWSLVSQFNTEPLYTGVKPTSPAGQNYCVVEGNRYIFKLGSTIKYDYTVDGTNGKFSPIKTYASDGSSFIPSNGGIFVDFNGTVFPWNANYTLIGHRLDKDADGNNGTVVAEWYITANGQSCMYRYRLRIEGRTLIVHVEVLSNKDHVLGIVMNQCEGAVDPHAIAVPYLPLFHILKANNEFTSFFADWKLSNASEIVPFNIDSPSYSVGFYAQQIFYKQLTDLGRNILDETLYLTTSPNIEDVFPNIPNPQSTKKTESANSILWDYRSPYTWLITNPGTPSGRDGDLCRMGTAGITNLWLQIHNWQHLGYDNGYPCVLPANIGTFVLDPTKDGTTALNRIIQEAQNTYGCRVGLHQNYVDYYPNAIANDGICDFNMDSVARWTNWSAINAFMNGFG